MKELTLKTVFVVGLLAALAGLGLGLTDGQATDYQYTIKTEQVQTDAGYSGNATSVEQLSESEQEVLYRAFKNSDGFLEGASAYIETDEPLNISEEDRWQVVTVEGVHLLVGFSGPEKIYRITLQGFVGMVLMILGGFTAFTAGGRAVIRRRE